MMQSVIFAPILKDFSDFFAKNLYSTKNRKAETGDNTAPKSEKAEALPREIPEKKSKDNTAPKSEKAEAPMD